MKRSTHRMALSEARRGRGRYRLRACICGAFLLVGAARAGGGNLIENPGFEAGRLRGWLAWGLSQGEARITHEKEYARTGRRALQWIKRSDEEWSGASYGLLGPLKPGDHVYARAWVRMNASTDVAVFLAVALLDQEGRKLVEGLESQRVHGTIDWTELVLDCELPGRDALRGLKQLNVDLVTVNVGEDDEVFFDDIYVGTEPPPGS